jgi:hypothetical protein
VLEMLSAAKHTTRVGTGVVWLLGGGASPCGLPDCVAVDARASLAMRVGASAVLGHIVE